jgi:hypothetical protein
MTPKETAEDLISKFNYENKHYLMLDAKQCALILIDEMIKEILRIEDNEGHLICCGSDYWIKVKKEIEKL